MNVVEVLRSWPTWALVALGVVFVAEIVLAVYAFRDLYRRPNSQLAFGNKWIWVAIIVVLLNSGIGPIIYLVAGRKPAPVAEVAPHRPAASRAENAADALYGARKDTDRR
jgi:hypothetical protein